MNEVPERWLTLAAQGVYNENAVEGMSMIRSRLNARAALEPVVADFRQQVEALPHDPRCHVYLRSADEYTMCSCWKRHVLRLIAGGGDA